MQLFKIPVLKITLFNTTLLILALLTSANMVSAAEQAPENKKLIEDLLADLGIVSYLNDIPKIMQDGLNQRQQERQERGESSRDYIDQLSPVVKQYFSRQQILAHVSASLAQLLKEERYTTLKRLFASPRVKNLMATKESMRSVEAIEAIKNLATEHEDRNIKKYRLDLIDEFDNATAETEFFVAVQALSIESILKLSNAYSVKIDKKTLPGIKGDVLSSTYGMLLRPSKYNTMMTFRHMFRNNDDDDIKQAIAVYRQPQVQWLLQNTMVALSAAIQDATTNAIKALHARNGN